MRTELVHADLPDGWQVTLTVSTFDAIRMEAGTLQKIKLGVELIEEALRGVPPEGETE